MIRRVIGILGILFPIILVSGSMMIGGCREVQPSLSTYYYTNMRDIFVGGISLVSLMFFIHAGYTRKEKQAYYLAGAFALGIAFFPTSVQEPISSCISHLIDRKLIGTIHLLSAVAFFLVLAYISIFLFIEGPYEQSPYKSLRNRIYKICGWVILWCTVLIIAIYVSGLRDQYREWRSLDPILWLETVALFALGISWLTKGGAWLRDSNHSRI